MNGVLDSGDRGILFDSDVSHSPDPLCIIPPEIDWNFKSSDWVLSKVEEIKDCVGISCEEYDEQFRPFLQLLKLVNLL